MNLFTDAARRALVLASFALGVVALALSTAAAQQLTAVGGGVGGAWYSTLGSFAGIVNGKHPEIQIRVVPGSGIGNSATIGDGTHDLGWVYPSFLAAAREGIDPYNSAYPDLLAAIGGFSPTLLHLAVTSDLDVSSFEEIVEKKLPAKFVTGRKSTTPAWFFDRMLEFYNVTVSDIESWGGSVTYAPYSDWQQLIQDGHANAFFDQIAVPSPVLAEIQVSREVKLLSLPQAVREQFEQKFALAPATIPAETYKGQTEEISTLSLFTVLAANRNVSEDAVYKVVSTMIEEVDAVRKLHASFESFDPKQGWQHLGGPMHPGAERAFRDAGIQFE